MIGRVPFNDLRAQHQRSGGDIDAAVADCFKSAEFIQGRRVREFEEGFSRYLGVKHVVACGSGTDAIFLALKALGVGTGDEVITAANSFIATAEAIEMTGGKTVFADVDGLSGNITVEKIERLITDRTRVIVPVHLYGHPAELDSLKRFTERACLRLLNDAAQAHGAKFMGKHITAYGDITAFSFYPGKNLGACGDAGAIATDDHALAETISMMRDHGRKEKHVHEFQGYNMRMDEIQGAVLQVKLPLLEGWIKRRCELGARYREALTGVGDIELPVEKKNVRAVYHLFVIETSKRDALRDFLREKGVATGIHYPLIIPMQPAYSHLKHTPADFPVASRRAGRILSLPIYPEMSEEQQRYVIEKVKDFYG